MEFPPITFDYANPQQCIDLLASVPLILGVAILLLKKQER